MDINEISEQFPRTAVVIINGSMLSLIINHEGERLLIDGALQANSVVLTRKEAYLSEGADKIILNFDQVSFVEFRDNNLSSMQSILSNMGGGDEEGFLTLAGDLTDPEGESADTVVPFKPRDPNEVN